MKTKDSDWYEQQVESIRKRKRKLHYIIEPKVRKRMKADLKREQRGAKRSEKNSLKSWIDRDIQRIRNNEYNLKEGVIVKGVIKEKRKSDEVWMVKVKTLEWLNKVKSRYGERALLEELNGDKTLI